MKKSGFTVRKRRFAAEVPFLVQWDDHETHNNWYPGESLAGDTRYKQVTSADALAANARRAMFEYNTFRANALEAERVYRRLPYGPLLEVFIESIDEGFQGHRAANHIVAGFIDAASGAGTDRLECLVAAFLRGDHQAERRRRAARSRKPLPFVCGTGTVAVVLRRARG